MSDQNHAVHADHTLRVQQLFVQHQRRLRAFVLSLAPDFSAADDVLQETFLVVTRKAAEFEPGTNFFAWARQIATFKALALARDRQRGPLRLADDVVEALAAAGPLEDDEAQHVAEIGRLRRCLEKLAPAARELVRLRYFGEHLPEQIARLRSQSVNAVNVTAAAHFWSRPTPVSEPTTAAVAVLTRAVDVQWSDPGQAYRIGAALAPGWLRLKTGLAQVEFFNGARVLLEGPAELQLVSASQAFFRHGRLSAEVPPQAVGFTVDTPQVNVVDRGTAFGLDVTGDGAEVHVFKGEVIAGEQRLKEGEAVAVAGEGQSRLMPATPVAFPSVAEFERRSSEAQQRQLAAWRGAARKRNADSALLLRFDFESFPASRALPNVAARGELAGDGTIVGCEQTEGRWPGKGALGFHSVGDRVRIHVPGRLRSVTLAAWVRVDGLDRTFNSLVMSQGYDAGSLHWQINQHGVVHIGVRGADKSSTHDYGTPVVFTPDRFGRWTHLAVVFDADVGQVTH